LEAISGRKAKEKANTELVTWALTETLETLPSEPNHIITITSLFN
jgi:hypothetical protein